MKREKVKERMYPYPNLAMETKRDHHDVNGAATL